MTQQQAHRQRGFTLIEMMTVMTIIAIVVGIGVPSFRQFIVSHRLSAASNALMQALLTARSAAITRGARVDITPPNAYYRSLHPGAVQGGSAGNSDDWSHGWIVFVNKQHDHNTSFDAGDTLLQAYTEIGSDITVRAQLTDNNRPYIAYNGTGRTHTDNNMQQPQAGAWEFSIGQQQRLVIVGLMGRPHTCNPKATPAACNMEQTD